jgi:hypothetical protein
VIRDRTTEIAESVRCPGLLSDVLGGVQIVLSA